ncbi:MAG: MBL fold metallo-hydrolase [Actinomycetota bacterium]|nr:MBL fold metallo-hydrolase [Actinomycetota bacterium]
MSELTVQPVVDEGLGNTSYLVDLADGRALVVDVSRDLRAVRAAAEHRGLRIAWAVDTHLHADFLSGAHDLAAHDGAAVLASAAGSRLFDHTGLADGDEVDLGGLHLRAIGTPGHTDEHLAFTLHDGPRTLGAFTGGSLLVGAVARTDLVDRARTEELARAQYRSVQRLLALPDDTLVWPTHGAGSFCSAPAGADRTTSIGAERATNPLLAAPDEDEFVARLLASLGSYPPYFRELPERNRRGPAPFPTEPGLRPLDAAGVARARSHGAQVVDVRPVEEFSHAHLPGSLSIALRGAFASWLGWLTTPERRLVVVRNEDQDSDEIVWQAVKIGYDNVDTELRGGISAWAAAGFELTSTPLLPAESLDQRALLDVRQSSEYLAGHVAGAAHVELGDLGTQTDDLPAGPLAVMCGHGERAMTAASVLERAGRTDLVAVAGKPEDVSTHRGGPLEAGR